MRDPRQPVERDRERDREGSAFCSATAFGTSSPSTTERYVRIANAIRNETVVERAAP